MGAPKKSTAKNPSRVAAKSNVQAKKAIVNNRCVSSMHATQYALCMQRLFF